MYPLTYVIAQVQALTLVAFCWPSVYRNLTRFFNAYVRSLRVIIYWQIVLVFGSPSFWISLGSHLRIRVYL